MFSDAFKAGLRRLTQRKGLAVLVYGLNLGLALVLALPVYFFLDGVVGPTGYGQELAGSFDLVLWVDVLDEMGPLLGALLRQAFWLLPVVLVLKAVVAVGLIHALRDGGVRSFWTGVGRYGARAVGLALLFLLPLLGWLVLTAIAVFVLNALFPGEVGVFWSNFVALPTLLITGAAILDLMHDYARIALVCDEETVTTAFRTGFAWPLRHGTASWLYVAWFVPALALWLLPFVLDTSLAGATLGGVLLLFALQQVVLLARAGVTVAWFGSEVALFEAVRFAGQPLIVEDAPPADRASAEAASPAEHGQLGVA